MSLPDVDVYRALDEACTELGVDWYVFGAQAAILHGATRFTEDVDVTVRLGGVATRDLVAALGARSFTLRVDDADDFVARTRVLPLLHEPTGIPVDVVLAGPGLEDLFMKRAQRLDVGGARVPVVSPEDLIVMKILAGRAKDLEDVAAVLVTRSAALDFDRVRDTLRLVERALDQSDLLPLFEQCLRRSGAPGEAH